MFKNQIRIISVKKSLENLAILFGKTSPEFKVMKFLLTHFYQNEILSVNVYKIATQLSLNSKIVNDILTHLVHSGVINQSHQIYFLNTDLVLNQ